MRERVFNSFPFTPFSPKEPRLISMHCGSFVLNERINETKQRMGTKREWRDAQREAEKERKVLATHLSNPYYTTKSHSPTGHSLQSGKHQRCRATRPLAGTEITAQVHLPRGFFFTEQTPLLLITSTDAMGGISE